MDIVEKVRNAINETFLPVEEKYHGLSFMYYAEIITLEEYKKLIKEIEK